MRAAPPWPPTYQPPDQRNHGSLTATTWAVSWSDGYLLMELQNRKKHDRDFCKKTGKVKGIGFIELVQLELLLDRNSYFNQSMDLRK
jgi:hypothetical protein